VVIGRTVCRTGGGCFKKINKRLEEAEPGPTGLTGSIIAGPGVPKESATSRDLGQCATHGKDGRGCRNSSQACQNSRQRLGKD
jgi:hypothetical protein